MICAKGLNWILLPRLLAFIITEIIWGRLEKNCQQQSCYSMNMPGMMDLLI